MLRVSVIIPAFNSARYLPEALQSILGQSLRPKEVIVVDDGSTDNTAQVALGFGPPVRYDRQPHSGVTAARNRGLDLASGDVVAWLDADDIWEPDFLSTLIPLLARDAAIDGAYCGLMQINTAGKVLSTPVQRVVPPQDLFSALIEADFVLTPTIVMRKKCYDDVGPFDPQFRICEDYDMWLRLAQRFTIVGIPRPLVRIRVHEDSTIMRDGQALCDSRLALTRKHFGAPEGDPAGWSESKQRAYAYAFCAWAVRYIQDGRSEAGWGYFQRAAEIWPRIADRLDVFYELACGDQPRGYRGRADLLDIEGNGRELLKQLDTLFLTASPDLGSMRGRAYGNAYLALGMLSDQAGNWSRARGYLFRAVAANPRLLGSASIVRRIVKLCLGRRLVDIARNLLRGEGGSVQENNL